jgi:L-fuconolactonase
MIDAHLHVWEPSRGGYRWITPELGPLHADIPPDRAAGELAALGVDAAVLVQADDTVEDTGYLLEVARARPWVAGVVGWVRLDYPRCAAEHLRRFPGLCGVRHLVHDDPRDGFLALPAVRESLRLVAARGLPLDVPDAWPRHLGATAALAAALPELVVVLDHLGKPPHGRPDFTRWRAGFAEVAALPNTVAKVSGLQVPGTPTTVAGLRPAWEAALELFGPARLMWGSDWPMTLRTEGYRGTWEVLGALVGELSADERADLLGGTATRVYRLGRPPGTAAAVREGVAGHG